MSFDVAADAYGRFMGRYSEQLGDPFLDFVGVRAGQRALDVGCGPGALTARLVDRLGPDAVAAVDPSPPFLAAVRDRLPGVDVRQGRAEQLPFDSDVFDVALAQLVVHFMTDPVSGLAEMSRVVTPRGTVAASVWDHGGGRGPLNAFWDGVRTILGATRDESALPGVNQGELADLFRSAGLRDVRTTELTVSVEYRTFQEWWEPFGHGVGPAGEFVASLDAQQRATLRDGLASRMTAPFEITATAWSVRGTA